MTLFEKSTSMQIIPFPAHYQSIYINFDISSFSLISCDAKEPILNSKIGSFDFKTTMWQIRQWHFSDKSLVVLNLLFNFVPTETI